MFHFPCVLLYDEVMQSDLIHDFGTNTTFREQLEMVLAEPAPWDPNHTHNAKNVELFYETNMSETIDGSKPPKPARKYVHVDLDSTLEAVLKQPNCIVPQYPVFLIVSKDRPILAKYQTYSFSI